MAVEKARTPEIALHFEAQYKFFVIIIIKNIVVNVIIYKIL